MDDKQKQALIKLRNALKEGNIEICSDGLMGIDIDGYSVLSDYDFYEITGDKLNECIIETIKKNK